jgi:ATP-binding cassette subfamily B protein
MPSVENNSQKEYSYLSLLKNFYYQYIRKNGRIFFPIQILHGIEALLALIPPLILREIIDQAIPNKAIQQLFLLASLALAIYIIKAIMNIIKIYWGHRISQEITCEMRNDLYSHYQRLPLSFHDNKKTGELMSRLIDDLNILQEFIHHGPEGFINSSVLLIGTIAILFSLSVQLTLVSLIFVPLLAVFSYYLLTKMHYAFRETREKKAAISNRLEDNLTGVKVIKVFTNEKHEINRFSKSNEDHKVARLTAIKYLSLLFPCSNLLNAFGILAVLSYGGYLVVNGNMTIGTIVAFYGYLLQFRTPILRLVHVNERLSRFFASIERFFSYMEIEPAIKNKPSSYKNEEIKGEIEFKDVNFSYNSGEEILKKVSFKIKASKTIALVGPSGAGKTSTVRLIPRLYDIDSGQVLIDGIDVKEWDIHSLRSSIAMVMQDDFLFSDSVAENIIYGKTDARKEEIIEVAKKANAHEFIKELPKGYDTLVGERGVKLSGGQRQRVSIARAFLKNPDILILDEATSSVDLHTEKLIQEAIDRVAAGRTTFIIAHRLSTIINADQILFIEKGKIKEKENHQELMAKKDKYYQFYKMQFENQEIS